MIKIVSESARGCEGGNNSLIENHLGALLLKTSKSSGLFPIENKSLIGLAELIFREKYKEAEWYHDSLVSAMDCYKYVIDC